MDLITIYLCITFCNFSYDLVKRYMIISPLIVENFTRLSISQISIVYCLNY